MKQFILLLALLLVFPVAAVANGEDQCRNIKAQASLLDEHFDCEYGGTDYDYCYISKIQGNFKGLWTTYVQFSWYEILEDLGVQTGTAESWYNREFEVFTTKQGTVWGDAQFVFDDRYFQSNGGTAIPTMITGGTGIYADATGWITLIYTDGTIANWRVYGRVCGPNIEK